MAPRGRPRGGDRRGATSGLRASRVRRAGAPRSRSGRRPCRARSRWRAAARPTAARRRRRGRGRAPRRGDPGRAHGRDRSSGSTAALVEGTVDRPRWGRRRRRRACAARSCEPPHASAAAVGDTWTDEAALLEACRIPVHVVPGEPGNLKVTVPADLARAARLLGDAAAATDGPGSARTATRSGPAAPLRLGGIVLAGAPRLLGHSDGDVALHAVADALLGAAGLGDLGRLFPAGAVDAGRHRERRAAGDRRRAPGRGRLATRGRRRDDHRGPAATRRRLETCATRDRRAARRSTARPSTSRHRPATSRAPRAPAGRSRRSPSRPS